MNRSILLRLRIAFVLTFAVLITAPLAGQDSPGLGAGTQASNATAAKNPATRFYKIRLNSKATMQMQGQTQQIDADTTVGYHRSGPDPQNRVDVGLDAINVKATVNGATQIDSFQSKEKLIVVQGGQTQTVLAKDAEAPLQQMLQDTFGSPACRLTLDENGEIVHNESLLRPGAKSIEDQGIVANILFFHAPFTTDAKSWTSVRKVSMGNGGFVEGELTYSPKSNDGARHVVDVSGTLKNPRFQPAGTPLQLRDTAYEISGSQVYDTDLGDWVSGNLTAELKYDMFVNDMPVGKVTGTIVLTLSQLDEAVSNP